jgi:pyruvate/2-oxoglutarate dehydrogenase complex dihydrolipoamide dehydrogenase (E3) component
VIIGATIVGEGAGDMISEVTVAMQAGLGLAKLVSAACHLPPARAYN